MAVFNVEVTQWVKVTLDESKFTPEFMAEFQESFFAFDTLDEHAEHIAQLAAREVNAFGHDRQEFAEGYGEVGQMGIWAEVESVETFASRRPSDDDADPINLQGSGPAPIEPRER